MDSFTLIGKYKLDKNTTVKDPLVTILRADYNYEAMNVVLTAKFDNGQYSLVRDMDPNPITDTNGLSKEQVISIVQTSITLKKQ